MSMMDLASIQSMLEENIPLLKAMGVKIESLGEGEAVTSMPFKPDNLNHVGTIYAGALFSHAEVTAGVTLFSRFSPTDFRLLIKHMEIEYKKKVTTDVTGKAKIDDDLLDLVRKDLEDDGRSARTFPVFLFAGDEEVAEAQVTFHLKKLS